MKLLCMRAAGGVLIVLATIGSASPLWAQGRQAAPAGSTPAAQPVATQPAAPQSAIVPSATPEPDQSRAVTAGDDAGRSVTAAGRIQRDLSPWSMFLGADILVKVVIVSLAFASLATWTIFFAKTMQLSRAVRRLRAALARVAEMRTLSEAQMTLGPIETVLSSLLRSALQEVKLSGDSASDEGIKERASSRFSEIARAEARSIRQGMAILATIGATSPFVGLFGTVWGIMNSFIGISKAQTTNLAVVAPGIAEALLATAVGLVAAIPAVIIYNHFSRATKGYVELVGRCSGVVARLLSRDLDRVRDRLVARAAE